MSRSKTVFEKRDITYAMPIYPNTSLPRPFLPQACKNIRNQASRHYNATHAHQIRPLDVEKEKKSVGE